MLNEAARCLEEGILETPRDGDIGAIFGLGYPPFLGGPFQFMDTAGLAQVCSKLQELADSGLTRFTPCDLINKLSKEEGATFYS